MHNNGIFVGRDLNVHHGDVTNTVLDGSGGDTGGSRDSGGRQRRRSGLAALIITALQEEHDAVKAVVGWSEWQEHGVGGASPYATATVRTESGEKISVALARPTQMGGRSTAPIATTLADRLRPTCLAMCGVCAGNPGATAPGDVIVAAPAYEWDEGQQLGGVFRADHQQFPLDIRWVRAVQDFDPSGLPSYGVATDEEAKVWYLERLLKGQNPRTHPARRRYFPRLAWETRLQRFESEGLIARPGAEPALTDAGRAFIQRVLYDAVDGPERLPFTVQPGPMASGSAVMMDAGIWDRLEGAQRKILALEMEAATIATVAHNQQVPHWLVAKSVMDHADLDKDDRFKPFAAKASAEVLVALLGRLLVPAAGSPHRSRSSTAIPGPVKLEVLRRLTYDWQDIADNVGVPSPEVRRFRAGDEPRELWDWLADRDRLADLPGALDEINRADLAGLLRPYL